MVAGEVMFSLARLGVELIESKHHQMRVKEGVFH